MTDILLTINQQKKADILVRKAQQPLADLKRLVLEVRPPRDFLASIHRKHQENQPAIIAEIKKRSPSKGLIREDFHPTDLARQYTEGGAACLSVLTDQAFFDGHSDYLKAAKAATSLPVLCKDFMVDPYQIYEARTWGADAILLIATSLSQTELEEFEAIAHELNMTALIELHDQEELSKCTRLKSPLFGVNNRNLRTFDVNMQQTLDIAPYLNNKTIVCESGIHHHKDIAFMQENGIHTFLVGESLMRQADVTHALSELIGN